MVKVRFTPQAWFNDYTIEVAAEGPIKWEVGEVPEEIEDDSYESDDLRFHPNAPDWVREWAGPFYITVDRD